MSYSKLDLQNLHSLTLEEVNDRLNACGLPLECENYGDEEIKSGFEVICSYFANELVTDCAQAAELFKQQTLLAQQSVAESELDDTGSTLDSTQTSVMDFSTMRDWVSQTIGVRVSWKEAGELLQACGLPDLDEYNEAEAERFLEACDNYKNQQQTISQIAAQFQSDGQSNSADDNSNSVNGNSSSNNGQLKPAARQVAEQIEKSATTARQGVAHLIDTVVGLDAKGISAHVNQSYLKQVAIELEAGRHDIEVFYAELEEWTLAQIEGKRQAHSTEETWEWAADSLPPSSTKPPLLPEASNNGTTEE